MHIETEDNMSSKKKATDKKSEKPKTIEGESGATIPEDAVCRKAPEWAEHARLDDEDQPCDDGRTGNLERNDDKD
jgi:hypothetical protein